MKRAGFYSEIAGARVDASSVVAAPVSDNPDRHRIARYLAEGYVVLHVPDGVADPLRPDRIAGKSSILTDGEWVWPHAYPYFVRIHGVAVPDELANRAREHHWSVPNLSEESLLRIERRVLEEGAWVETDFGDDPFGDIERAER